MPIFPRFHYPESRDASYSAFPTDFLRLIEGLDTATPSSSTTRRGFSPSFDVLETEHEYILEGELSGLSDKNNVNIEFTDDNTMYIHGKIESSFKGDVKTIEDSSKEAQKPATSEIEKNGPTKGKSSSGPTEKKPKYWVSERSVGEFSRSFCFPSTVDVDNVKATLEHGILKIVVPKLEKKTGRKVEITSA
jgi:HSP20 family protein